MHESEQKRLITSFTPSKHKATVSHRNTEQVLVRAVWPFFCLNGLEVVIPTEKYCVP
jgi:hypothetical protein